MADSIVLQEFLMELGFKVERSTLEAFTKSLKGGATEAVTFGEIWSKVAEEAVHGLEAIVKGVFQMTQQLETLYFASRRIGDTAENIDEISFALSQVGISAGDAQQAMEGVRHAIDLFGPQSITAILPGLDIRGIENNPALILQKILERLHNEIMSANQAERARAIVEMGALSRIGINVNEGMARQYDPAEAARAQKEYNDTLAELGENETEAAQNAHEMEEALRDLQLVMKLLFEKYALPLIKGIKDLTLAFKDEALKLHSELIPALGDTLEPLMKLLGLLQQPAPKGFVYSFVDDITYMTRVVQAALGLLHAELSGDMGKTAAYGVALERWWKIWQDYDAKAGTQKAPSPADLAAAEAATAAAEGVSGTKQQGLARVNAAVAAAAANVAAGGVPAAGAAAPATGGGPPAGYGEHASVRHNNPGDLMDPQTGQLRTFPSWAAGVQAMKDQLRVDYQQHHLGTVRAMIHRWASGSYAGNNPQTEAAYARYVAGQLGVGVDQPVDYQSAALVDKTVAAMAAFEGGWWLKGAAPLVSGAGGGAGAVQNNTVNITVSGAGDPKAVADHVVMNIETTHQRLMRAFHNPGP